MILEYMGAYDHRNMQTVSKAIQYPAVMINMVGLPIEMFEYQRVITISIQNQIMYIIVYTHTTTSSNTLKSQHVKSDFGQEIMEMSTVYKREYTPKHFGCQPPKNTK